MFRLTKPRREEEEPTEPREELPLTCPILFTSKLWLRRNQKRLKKLRTT
jgi:hypothetical protein